MNRVVSGLLGLGIGLFAAFPAGTSYKLNSYSVGPGGSNTTSSTTYKAQVNLGEQVNNSTTGTAAPDTSNNGGIGAEQLNVPPAPTLSNGAGTYYNKLNFIISTGGNPSDSTFAVAVSTNNFVSTFYVQADGTLGATAVYQTYITWGGGGGSFMTGLTPSTAYKAKVAAKQGNFTNTNYGAAATASTVAASVTFSVSPNSTTLSNLLPNTIITSSNLSFTYSTNAANGGGVYVSGSNTGLLSTAKSYTLSAFTGNLAPQTQGFGIQASTPSQSSGGPLNLVSPFNGTSNVVGAESTVPKQILSSSAPIVSGTAIATLQAKASSTTPSSTDYQETLTFIASASF
jgi:hypothetical protein